MMVAVVPIKFLSELANNYMQNPFLKERLTTALEFLIPIPELPYSRERVFTVMAGFFSTPSSSIDELSRLTLAGLLIS